MHDLISVTALGGATASVVRSGDATCAEITDLALVTVTARAGQARACADRLGQWLGAPPPGPGGAVGAALGALWIGPDSWLVHLPYATCAADRVAAQVAGCGSVTDQTDAWAVFDLSRAPLPPLIERLCNLDPRRLTPGHGTGTVIHHLSCHVIRLTPERMRVLGPRSAAGSLHHALLTAMDALARQPDHGARR